MKVGLALGSGGFRGPALVGVIDTLLKNNIPIDYIAGSSIGALVGAYYAVYQNSQKLKADFFGKSKEKLRMIMDLSAKGGLLNGGRLEKIIQKGLGNKEFKDVKIPIKIVATDLVSGRPFIFEHGSLALAARASASVPLTFKPVKFKDKLLVDGGLSLPVPDMIVRDMGADLVISVNLYNDYKFLDVNPSTAKVVMRGLELLLRRLAQAETRHSDFIIEPDTSGLSMMSRLKKYWDEKAMQEMMRSGQEAALKIIPEIKKKLGI